MPEEIDKIIVQAPANSAEYKVYNNLGAEVSNSDLYRRIDWLQLRASNRIFNTEYKKAVILYLQLEIAKRRTI